MMSIARSTSLENRFFLPRKESSVKMGLVNKGRRRGNSSLETAPVH